MSENPRPPVLITGGTSGIGLACARTLGRAGHRVYVCARTTEDVVRTVKRLREEGISADGRACDVRDSASVADLVAAATDRFGAVGVLVNSAGRNGGGVTRDVSEELWRDVVETNLTGVFLTTRQVLAEGGMLDLPSGRIVNIASTGGKQGVAFAAPYSASKHGVVGFSKALGKELAATGTTVNAVCPGYVETPMAERVRADYAAGWSVSEEGAATVEFLTGPDGAHYFMEVNSRIQVEHPVTEMAYGVDLVREQLLAAAGEPLSAELAAARPRGAVIECRVNAEDPERGFAPAPGTLEEFTPPGGPFVRVDTHARAGMRIPAAYDSLLAKVVVWAPDRTQALARAVRALEEFRVAGAGVRTTIPFLLRVLRDPDFRAGRHDTGLVARL
ncbi:SDR family NAD(P)-dependent oxidoreductase [Streptomonospora nanhaiensis]|uniref:SDR family NAD(P)-dependent oxidoreductase n=1 Tax=Streptomonospora nanhaiensis TaxID=1323731 RepID=UPI001C99F2D9|nr:SDR family NAD(P)-dependent oxidoreductase [Streptomonospora nanhaiensis]MBX9390301.1 SDR family NAD(P)-dependent oxidoreductase [Streptomonospora nanhaiensis]